MAQGKEEREIMMLIYSCGFDDGTPRKPLTEHSASELAEHCRNIANGQVADDMLYSPAAVLDQINIIVFARQMGWL